MFDGEIADMTRSGALADARAGIDRAIISALDARSGRLSRPALTALAVQIDNAARKISALAGQIGALNTDTRDAQAHARTAAEALAALTAEMARIDAATGPTAHHRKAGA